MKKIKGFTLLEMLVVMFIISIMLAIFIPTFSPMMNTTKVNRGTEMIYKTLEFARQYAVTHGNNTMVVFATTNPANSTINMAHRAYKVYSAGTGTILDWQFLLNGTQLDTDSSEGSSTILGNITSIPFPNDGDANTNVANVEFKPDGRPKKSAGIKVIDIGNPSRTFRRITYTAGQGRIKLHNLGEEDDN